MTATEFELAVSKLTSHLAKLARKFTPNQDDAKDLIQDTLLKALKHRDKFVRDENLSGWLYRIMKNTYINQYRKKMRENTYFDHTENLFQLNVADYHTAHNPDKETIYRDFIHHSAEVKPVWRVPLKMHYLGYKYQEIAEKLGIPVGTVKNRIFNARKQLQEIMNE